MDWPQTCKAYPALVKSPPAIVSGSLAARYPNGADVRVTVTIDPAGRVTGVTSNADRALAPVVAAWATSAAYSHPADLCPHPPARGSIDVEQNFFPEASGVLGSPQTVHGVAFDDLDKKFQPGKCALPGTDPDNGTPNVDRVFAGPLANTVIAIAILRCEHTPSGFESTATVFALDGGVPRKLGDLGSSDCFSAGCATPDAPGGWIYVSFRDGKLYADVWNEAKRCKRNGDWTSTTYTLVDGKLKALDVAAHHRAGIARACDEHYL